MSLARTLGAIRRSGLKEWWRQMQYIGVAKSGTHVGTDQFGNRYFENMNPRQEIPGRHRWVDFAQHDNNASQIPPEWHSWITHIREKPPQLDEVMQASAQPWQGQWRENLTGTRGAYRPYNTVVPKVSAWEPKVAPRE